MNIALAIFGTGLIGQLFIWYLNQRQKRKEFLIAIVFDNNHSQTSRQVAYYEYRLKGYNGAVEQLVNTECSWITNIWQEHPPSLKQRIIAKIIMYPKIGFAG